MTSSSLSSSGSLSSFASGLCRHIDDTCSRRKVPSYNFHHKVPSYDFHHNATLCTFIVNKLNLKRHFSGDDISKVQNVNNSRKQCQCDVIQHSLRCTYVDKDKHNISSHNWIKLKSDSNAELYELLLVTKCL